MGKRLFYRFNVGTDLGKQFRKFWYDCDKAERAANVYAQKVGAKQFYSSPAAFAGGVVCVSFDEGEEVNARLWRSVGKDADGIEMYEPNVKQRHGVLVLPRRGFQPSDTAQRIYQKRPSPWSEVCQVYTLEEWSEIAGIKLTGDKQKDFAALTKKMSGEMFCKYIEIYRDDEEVNFTDNRCRMTNIARKSILIEKQRLMLPLVRTERLYQLLQADETAGFKDGKPHLVQHTTPTFFEYGGRYYIGIDIPCRHESLEEISEAKYNMKKVDLVTAERCKQQQEEMAS